jgi:hypothetical protein
MYNHDLLNQMIEKFGKENVSEFAKMISFMHHVLHENAKKNGRDEPLEHSFERDWWKDKHEELKNVTL